MSRTKPPVSREADSFFSLVPDSILDAVEGSLGGAAKGFRATGRVMPLNSIENRVLEIEFEGRESCVAKFYRPGRWTPAQILEEHLFTARLDETGIPVVVPFDLVSSDHSIPMGTDGKAKVTSSLARSPEGLFFAVFRKVRGRILDELNDERLKILGRFIARLHAVGEQMGRSRRLKLNIESFGIESLEGLMASGFLDSNMGQRYASVATTCLEQIGPWFEDVEMQIVHGDCHLGNVLWDMDSPFIVDFDDMVTAPPVQDIWMIVRGNDDEALRQRDVVVDAYEELRHFDRSTLDLVEPLRILRMIHYSAWIARRWEDPSFPRMFPTFGSDAWWQSELEGLDQSQTLLFGGNR